MRYNPFQPGTIVAPGIFSGRMEELSRLEQILFQTKNENPQHFLITGERGIGKSSLFFYLEHLAKGQLGTIEGVEFKFLTVSIELEQNNTYFDLIRKVASEFKRTADKFQPLKTLLGSFLEFVKKIEAFGLKYQAKDTAQLNELIEDLTYNIENIMTSVNTKIDGVLLLIDEADKPSQKANLGEFLKLFTERLTKRGCNKVCVGLAGLPALTKKLQQSHESSVRIFDIFKLEPLLPNEIREVITKGLKLAEKKNGYQTKISDRAIELIITLSEGYPHFIQQFAYSAFEEDKDNNIDDKDIFQGAKKEGGAFHQLGTKYFSDLYFEQIGSNEYREVLKLMAGHLDDWVTRDEIRNNLNLKESTLNNALNALKQRNIIVAKEGEKGIYKLPTKSFAVWIRGFSQSKQNNNNHNQSNQ